MKSPVMYFGAICVVIMFLLVSSSYSNVSSVQATFQKEIPYEYHSYDSMTALLQHLAMNHSDIMVLRSIGRTYEGRDVWMVKLSNNPTDNQDEPAVLLMGAHHGNELPTYESLIFFIDYVVNAYTTGNVDNDNDGLLNEDEFDGIDNDGDGSVDEDPSEERIISLVNDREIFVIPMVNPDGVEYGWRKNCAPNYGPFGHADAITSHGVDLNRNYDYKWYLSYLLPLNYMLPFIMNDDSWNYRGTYPFSENETQAVRDFVVGHENIKVSLSYHSYSEIILFPWTHTSLDTPDEDLFISVGENMSRIDGYYLYTGGEYLIPRFMGTLGTSENWLYATQGILSFTMELCKTRAPTDPDVVLEYCMRHVGVNLYVAERSATIKTKIQVS